MIPQRPEQLHLTNKIHVKESQEENTLLESRTLVFLVRAMVLLFFLLDNERITCEGFNDNDDNSL